MARRAEGQPRESIELAAAKLASLIPIDPGPYTLRELIELHDKVQFDRWMHTAVILCQNANANRGKDQRPFDVWQFHPYWKGPKFTGLKLTSENLPDLKPLFPNAMTITVAEAAASVGEASVDAIIAVRPAREPLFRNSITITVDQAKQSLEVKDVGQVSRNDI